MAQSGCIWAKFFIVFKNGPPPPPFCVFFYKCNICAFIILNKKESALVGFKIKKLQHFYADLIGTYACNTYCISSLYEKTLRDIYLMPFNKIHAADMVWKLLQHLITPSLPALPLGPLPLSQCLLPSEYNRQSMPFLLFYIV